MRITIQICHLLVVYVALLERRPTSWDLAKARPDTFGGLFLKRALINMNNEWFLPRVIRVVCDLWNMLFLSLGHLSYL